MSRLSRTWKECFLGKDDDVVDSRDDTHASSTILSIAIVEIPRGYMTEQYR